MAGIDFGRLNDAETVVEEMVTKKTAAFEVLRVAEKYDLLLKGLLVTNVFGTILFSLKLQWGIFVVILALMFCFYYRQNNLEKERVRIRQKYFPETINQQSKELF